MNKINKMNTPKSNFHQIAITVGRILLAYPSTFTYIIRLVPNNFLLFCRQEYFILNWPISDVLSEPSFTVQNELSKTKKKLIGNVN